MVSLYVDIKVPGSFLNLCGIILAGARELFTNATGLLEIRVGWSKLQRLAWNRLGPTGLSRTQVGLRFVFLLGL